jgi:hypothetical protein
MSTEFGLFSQPDFGYDDFAGAQHEEVLQDAQRDEPSRSPDQQEAAHNVRRELVRLDEAQRPLIENKHYVWRQGRLKLIDDVLKYFTVEEVAAQVRELEARGPSYRPTTSNRRGSFHLEWDGDNSVVDIHSEAVGEHPEFVQNLLGGGRQSTLEQPTQPASLPASAETIALPGPAVAGDTATKSKSKSRRQAAVTNAETESEDPSVLSRVWGLRPNMDLRNLRLWRKRLKRAEWAGYLLAAELLTPIAIGLTPGDSPIEDKNYFLQTPVAAFHGIGRIIGFGKWVF